MDIIRYVEVQAGIRTDLLRVGTVDLSPHGRLILAAVLILRDFTAAKVTPAAVAAFTGLRVEEIMSETKKQKGMAWEHDLPQEPDLLQPDEGELVLSYNFMEGSI